MSAARFPVRAADRVEPLIDAAIAYPAMERLVLDARDRCYFGFRIFDPTTRLRSAEAREAGLSDWRELIAYKLRQRVRFRFLLADFDPIVANDLHQLAWRNARSLATVDSGRVRGRLQYLMVLHEGEVGGVVRAAFWPLVRRRLGRLMLAGPALVQASPGVAHHLRPSPQGFGVLPMPARLWPATHHQKMLVVDGARAIVGGIDVDERRFDDGRHDRPADQTWHDVSLALDGAIAGDVERHFIEVWNRDVLRYREARAGRDVPTVGVSDPAFPPTTLPTVDAEAAEAAATTGDRTGPRTRAPATVRLGRTWSQRRASPVAMVPLRTHWDIETQLIGIIGEARDLLYVENQFVRHMPIVDALLQALRRRPTLELIMLVPMAPDTVAFEGRTGIDQRYAEWLQTRALRRLMTAPGGRVGVFSLVGARPPANAHSGPRASAFGRGIIYLHSKVLIADDRVAHVSSANLNGRSLLMDTELGVEWRDPAGVAAFREELWRAHLGEAALVGPDRPTLADWRRLANQALLDRDRLLPQRIVPYHLARARRFSRYGFGIPKQYF